MTDTRDIFDEALDDNEPPDEETLDFANQLAEERLRGQDWLAQARKIKDEEYDEDPFEEDSEDSDDPPPTPPDDEEPKPKKKAQRNWLANKLEIQKKPEIMKYPGQKRGRPKGAKGKQPKGERLKRQKQEAIQVMMAAGVNKSAIPKLLHMHPDTMDKYFSHEMEYGEEILKTRMVNALIQKGLDGNVSALMFYLKSKGGWKEEEAKQLSADDRELSEVERSQRIVSLFMNNPELLEAVKQKRLSDAPPIEVTPTPKETVDKNNDLAEDDDDEDIFDL